MLVLAELHLREERCLARERVAAFECSGPGASDKPAFTAVLERERRRPRAAHPPQPVLHDDAPHAVSAATPPGSAAVLQQPPPPRQPPPLRGVEASR